MSELLTAFTIGTGAILTNSCMLPLYPGLIAFLAGSDQPRTPLVTRWLGFLVLSGILSMMFFIGWILYLLQQSFGSTLIVLLPVIYGLVITFGILLVAGYNPFTRLNMGQVPHLNNPYLTAYLYGLLLGPMTLPCTGPLVTSIFVLGAANTGALFDGLLYFLAFGFGFGWPLVLLPFIALPLQRHFVRKIAHHRLLLTRISGILLIGIGLFGFFTEVFPNV
jgi:cytochrome c-type biogenesis protein